MRSAIVLLLLGVLTTSALADDIGPGFWTETLTNAEHCVEQSTPDFEKAMACYEEALVACLLVPTDEHKLCLEVSVKELRDLLPMYNSHRQAEAIAQKYDPKRCEALSDPAEGLQTDEFLLQCELTSLATQVTAGHIASIWGEIPALD